MKLLALIVSAIAMTATAAHAQDATEFKNGGEFRARYENFVNKTAADNGQAEQHTDARVKWDVNVRKGEKLQAHVTLLHNARFGGAPVISDDTTSGQQLKYATADNNGLAVNRAWGWWRATDAVSFKVGRIGIDFADGSVFSENDWEAVPYAFEGLNAAFDTSFAMFNLYGVKLAELGANPGGNSDSEANLYMATMDLKNMPSAIKMANIHLIDSVRNSTATAGSANWQHIGATIGGDTAGIMYKVTGALQFGSFSKNDFVPAPTTPEQTLSASMLDAMVGYGMPETMGLKASVGYHIDSGDDNNAGQYAQTGDDKQNNYQTLYYDKHNNAGLMDVVRWGNLTYLHVNASIMPMEDLEAGIGYYLFNKSKSGGTTNFGRGITNTLNTAAPATTNSDTALGSEVDVFANKAYGPDLKIGARYSVFMASDALKNITPKQDKTAHGAYLQASITF